MQMSPPLLYHMEHVSSAAGVSNSFSEVGSGDDTLSDHNVFDMYNSMRRSFWEDVAAPQLKQLLADTKKHAQRYNRYARILQAQSISATQRLAFLGLLIFVVSCVQQLAQIIMVAVTGDVFTISGGGGGIDSTDGADKAANDSEGGSRSVAREKAIVIAWIVFACGVLNIFLGTIVRMQTSHLHDRNEVDLLKLRTVVDKQHAEHVQRQKRRRKLRRERRAHVGAQHHEPHISALRRALAVLSDSPSVLRRAMNSAYPLHTEHAPAHQNMHRRHTADEYPPSPMPGMHRVHVSAMPAHASSPSHSPSPSPAPTSRTHAMPMTSHRPHTPRPRRNASNAQSMSGARAGAAANGNQHVAYPRVQTRHAVNAVQPRQYAMDSTAFMSYDDIVIASKRFSDFAIDLQCHLLFPVHLSVQEIADMVRNDLLAYNMMIQGMPDTDSDQEEEHEDVQHVQNTNTQYAHWEEDEELAIPVAEPPSLHSTSAVTTSAVTARLSGSGRSNAVSRSMQRILHIQQHGDPNDESDGSTATTGVDSAHSSAAAL